MRPSAFLAGLAAAGCSIVGWLRSGLPPELVVRAADYSFSAPDTVTAGLVSLRLVNDGREMHQVQLLRISRGHSFEQLRESAAGGNPLPDWVTPVGGIDASGPRDNARVVLGVAAGQYAMICFIPSPADHRPHYSKGMLRSLVVREARAPGPGEPAADGRIILNDYSFTITPTLRSGRHTLRVENAAAQPHEVVIARLAPGKTMSDLLDWIMGRGGPRPGEPAGGTTAIAAGGVNFLTADFAPGNYVLLCFVPDASDGRPHLAHGMLSRLRIE
jgi:hypothetical protein